MLCYTLKIAVTLDMFLLKKGKSVNTCYLLKIEVIEDVLAAEDTTFNEVVLSTEDSKVNEGMLSIGVTITKLCYLLKIAKSKKICYLLV